MVIQPASKPSNLTRSNWYSELYGDCLMHFPNFHAVHFLCFRIRVKGDSHQSFSSLEFYGLMCFLPTCNHSCDCVTNTRVLVMVYVFQGYSFAHSTWLPWITETGGSLKPSHEDMEGVLRTRTHGKNGGSQSTTGINLPATWMSHFDSIAPSWVKPSEDCSLHIWPQSHKASSGKGTPTPF